MELFHSLHHVMHEMMAAFTRASASGAPLFASPRDTAVFLSISFIVFSRIWYPLAIGIVFFIGRSIVHAIEDIGLGVMQMADTYNRGSSYAFAGSDDESSSSRAGPHEHTERTYRRPHEQLRYRDTKLRDCYSVLGVSHHATLAEVRRAYRSLMKQHHPDRFARASNHEQNRALRITQKIREAYETIVAA